MDFLKKLLASQKAVSSRSILTNKFVLTSVIFLVWVTFFDKNRVITQIKLKNTVERLEGEREYYREKIAEAKLDRIDIEVNKEKYARERYFMHLPDEEVYIIER
jgi:cell division protein FtsB